MRISSDVRYQYQIGATLDITKRLHSRDLKAFIAGYAFIMVTVKNADFLAWLIVNISVIPGPFTYETNTVKKKTCFLSAIMN